MVFEIRRLGSLCLSNQLRLYSSFSLVQPYCLIGIGTVNVLKFHTQTCLVKWHIETVQTQIRLLEQSDPGLYCLPFHY